MILIMVVWTQGQSPIAISMAAEVSPVPVDAPARIPPNIPPSSAQDRQSPVPTPEPGSSLHVVADNVEGKSTATFALCACVSVNTHRHLFILFLWSNERFLYSTVTRIPADRWSDHPTPASFSSLCQSTCAVATFSRTFSNDRRWSWAQLDNN